MPLLLAAALVLILALLAGVVLELVRIRRAVARKFGTVTLHVTARDNASEAFRKIAADMKRRHG